MGVTVRRLAVTALLVAGAALIPLGFPAGAQVEAPDALNIVVTKSPAVLIQVAGAPVFVPVDTEGTAERVANASGDLYRATDTGFFWARAGKYWVAAHTLEGPYEREARPPKAIAALSPPEAAAPAQGGAVPTVYVRKARTVLVSLVGKLTLERIGEPGGVHAVTSTDADLFFYGRDRSYYLLAGGRWYRAPDLEGGWEPVAEVPTLFAKIPPDHARGYVLAAIAGTREHTAALAEIGRVSLRRVSSERRLDVTYYGAPQFEPIAGIGAAYAVNTPQDVFETGGMYYCCQDGVWYLATSPTGPWSVCAVVPDALYAIPPAHPKHRVTSVIVHPAEQSGMVLVGADATYDGWQVVQGRIVHASWDGPFPAGRRINGRYIGPYADGDYLAPHYGNWGRADWAARQARRRAARSQADGGDTLAEPATTTGRDAQDERWDLKERRERLNARGTEPAWYGEPQELEERRQNRRGWP